MYGLINMSYGTLIVSLYDIYNEYQINTHLQQIKK